ncbi:SDR family oxidoreductase [Spongiibacter tropicus]|uniref:SDR family oxidoreductase n=1 Tax=Spongiibacter tropicus TaxID=454602 RepID=UPI003A996562
MSSAEQKRLLIVGCGDIGSGVAEHFLQRGWQVQGLRRQTDKLPEGVSGIAADLSDPESLAALPPLSADYVLMTLTPASYTEDGYQRIFERAMSALLAAISPAPKRLLFVSSSGVYGQREHEWVDEDSPTEPPRFAGKSLLRGEQLALGSGTPCSVVRFTGIYGPGRFQMLKKVHNGECAPTEPLHYSNRIHRDDCVGFLCHLLERADAGEALEACYLASDDEPVAIQEVQRWLADQLDVPYEQGGAPIARTGSKRCANRRLRESGYELRYPNYQKGFATVLEGFRPDDL